MLDLIGALEPESRAFALDSGGPDILDGGALFCAVAIRLNFMSREHALSLTRWADQDDVGPIAAGARCPSYTGPMKFAISQSRLEDRELTLEDIWFGLSQYQPEQFRMLCVHYGIEQVQ